MDKTTRYRLTAAIGDALPGHAMDLTAEQAESPLYASRIAPILSGDEGGPSAEQIRADIMAELEANIPPFLADAKAQGERLVEAAQAEAKKIIETAQAEAKKIIETAQAEAMKLATAKPVK